MNGSPNQKTPVAQTPIRASSIAAEVSWRKNMKLATLFFLLFATTSRAQSLSLVCVHTAPDQVTVHVRMADIPLDQTSFVVALTYDPSRLECTSTGYPVESPFDGGLLHDNGENYAGVIVLRGTASHGTHTDHGEIATLTFRVLRPRAIAETRLHWDGKTEMRDRDGESCMMEMADSEPIWWER